MTWGVSTARRRPGELLTRGDVCHLHADRDGAERCGAAGPGAPDLVRLEQYSERVYRVLWSLSDTSGGELRRPTAGPAPAGPSGAPRLTAGAVPDADMIRAAADALGVDIVNLRRRRAGPGASHDGAALRSARPWPRRSRLSIPAPPLSNRGNEFQ